MLVKIADIKIAPGNVRRGINKDELAELTESIRKHGVLQPVLVRPTPSGELPYSLVAGERRVRAAIAAGLEEVPVEARELDDAQALELQLIENLQRADVFPVDEAEGFERLQRDHGYTVDDLAAKVAKERSYVVQRLQLNNLHFKLKERLRDGSVSLAAALVFCRLPDRNDQMRAYDESARQRWGDRAKDPINAREARQAIEQCVMRELSKAPFSTKAADLVPAAGPCTTCPKRTGNSPDLFADVKGKNSCTDPACFRRKADAAWKLRTAEAQQQGLRVLTDAEAKKASHSVDMLDLASVHAYSKGKPVTVAKVIEKAGVDVPVVIGRDLDTLEVREFVTRADFQKALPREKVDAKRVVDPYVAKERRERARLAAFSTALVGKLLEHLRGELCLEDHQEKAAPVIEAFVLDRAQKDHIAELLKSLGVQRLKKKVSYGPTLESPDAALKRWLDTFDATYRPRKSWEIVFTLALLSGRPFPGSTDHSPHGALKVACEAFGVDPKAVAAEVRKSEAKAPRTKRATKKAAGKKSPKKAGRSKPAPKPVDEDFDEAGDE